MDYGKVGVYVGKVIVGIFTIIGVVAAIRSCKISESTMNLTDDANKIAKSSLEQKRPVICLTPEQNKDGEYYTVKMTNEGISLIFQLKMENTGDVAAKDILLPEKGIVIDEGGSSPQMDIGGLPQS